MQEHIASLCQITTAADTSFLAPVFAQFVAPPSDLTVLPFTGQVLSPATNYLARVTYYDSLGNSATSAAVAFTTLADGTIPFPGDPWVECTQPAGV